MSIKTEIEWFPTDEKLHPDAATALVALNRLWGIGLSAQALEDLGRKLGADVPFLVRGGGLLGNRRRR